MNSTRMIGVVFTTAVLTLSATELRSQTITPHNDLVSDMRQLSETESKIIAAIKTIGLLFNAVFSSG